LAIRLRRRLVRLQLRLASFQLRGLLRRQLAGLDALLDPLLLPLLTLVEDWRLLRERRAREEKRQCQRHRLPHPLHLVLLLPDSLSTSETPPRKRGLPRRAAA